MASADPPAPLPDEPSPARARPVATTLLILTCAAAFLASYAFGGGLDLLTLVVCGAKDRELILRQGEWWRILSAGFLHAHALHLLVNVYALGVLGPLVERLWGTRRFLLIYLAALVGGNLASLVATEGVSVGASGAVFGLFGALVVFSTVYRRFVLPRARARLWLNLAGVAAVNIGLGLAVPFIDNAAHAGGFALGALAALLARPIPARARPHPLSELAAGALAALGVAATIWALAEAVQYAASSDWILLARTRLETRTIGSGPFTIEVPIGWAYEPPKTREGFHHFSRQGFAVVAVRVIPRSHAMDVEPTARALADQWVTKGAVLLARREITIGMGVGTDMVFRLRPAAGAQRLREVIFPTPSDQLVHVSCACADRRYRLLEILFDKIIQSIQVVPSPPGADAARSVWERMLKDPRDPEACVLLASHYRSEGRPEAAEQVLRLALGLRPDYPEAHDQLAYLYATASGRLRRPDAAIRHARRALALRPDTPMYLATLALAYEAAGRRAEALAAAQRAAALAPDDAHHADLVKRLEQH